MSQKTVQENTLVHKLEIMYHVSWKLIERLAAHRWIHLKSRRLDSANYFEFSVNSSAQKEENMFALCFD